MTYGDFSCGLTNSLLTKAFQEVLTDLKTPSHYHLLLLVAVYESLLDISSFNVRFGAHGI